MGTSVYTSLLTKDYKRKLGEIKGMRKELRDMVHLVLTKEQELKAIGIVLRTKEPSLDLNTIKSNATVPKVLGLKWNQQTTLILNLLRTSAKKVHIQDIVEHVITQGEIEIENRRARTVVKVCVRDTLKRLCNKGTIIHCYDGTPETEGFWSLRGSK